MIKEQVPDLCVRLLPSQIRCELAWGERYIRSGGISVLEVSFYMAYKDMDKED